jgi:LPXTG-site transpeptidase (sortase) family protein
MKWGDQIILHLADQRYIYQVREDKVVAPDDSSVIKHEDNPWLTLITCKDYNAATDSYDHRVVVRAVLVKVEAEPAPGTNSR